jgi:hypothetical protein
VHEDQVLVHQPELLLAELDEEAVPGELVDPLGRPEAEVGKKAAARGLELGGPNQDAAQHVAGQEHRPAEQHGARHDPAVVGADDRAGDVRDREAHEGDRPGGGDRAAREQHEARARRGAREPDALAERARDVVSERQDVEPPARGQGDDQARRDGREHAERDARVAAGDRADDPEPELVERLGVEDEDRARERDEERRQRRADEREPHRAGGAVPRPAQERDQQGAQRRARQREGHVGRGRRHAERRDRHDHGERGAGVDAEDPRLGERVARHALHERPGRPERRADEEAELRARHAEVADDDVGVAAVVGRERPDDLPGRDGSRADRERRDGAQGQQRGARDEAGEPPGVRVP